MNVWIISIGNELASGQTVDTNSAWLADCLAGIGIHVSRHYTIADRLEDIRDAFEEAATKADLVLVSGGLGPTPDDLTRHGLAAAMGRELVLDQASYDRIAEYFSSRRRSMHDSNRVQALIPDGSQPITNHHGTAPGIFAHLHDSEVYCMPGVPYEMKHMFERDVLPSISGSQSRAVIRQRLLRTFGMPESELGDKVADMMKRDRNPTIGTSAADFVITVRVVATAPSAAEAEALLDADVAELRRRLGRVVFGDEHDRLADAVARLLIEQNKTVSTVESCTGGLIAKRLTDVAGSSAYMVQGFVTYANEAKRDLMEVPMELIDSHGAVSHDVAALMASNCRGRSGTDFALATTGIAGPGGGTAAKPVGQVFIALAGPQGTKVREVHLGEHLRRDQIRDRTAKIALNLLRLRLLGGA